MSITKLSERYVDIKGTPLNNMSMLRMFNILKDENDEYFMNIFKNIEFDSTLLNDPTINENVGIVVPWWEMISYSYYNNIQAWWVTCATNNVVNPFEEIIEAGTLNMLSKDYIPYIQQDMEVIFNL